MPTYLYGLVLARNAGRVPGSIVGIQGTPVRTLTCSQLVAIVSTMARQPGPATLDDVRAHDAALQAAVDAGATVAAARFRQYFADDHETCVHVGERAERVTRLLEEHDGCVEMRILIPVSLDAGAGQATLAPEELTGPGRAYLERLREAAQSNRRTATIAAALGPTVRAERSSTLRNGVALAHLVHRDDIVAYREAVAGFSALAEATVVGPFALYSFAEPLNE